MLHVVVPISCRQWHQQNLLNLMNTQNLTQKEHDVAPSCSKHVVANLARWTPWNSEQPNLQKWGIKALRWWGERCDPFRNKMDWHSKTNRNKWSHRMFYYYVRTNVRKCKNSPAKNNRKHHLNQLTNQIRIIRNWGPNQASFPGSQYGLPRALHLVAKCVGTNRSSFPGHIQSFTEFNASHLEGFNHPEYLGLSWIYRHIYIYIWSSLIKLHLAILEPQLPYVTACNRWTRMNHCIIHVQLLTLHPLMPNLAKTAGAKLCMASTRPAADHWSNTCQAVSWEDIINFPWS